MAAIERIPGESSEQYLQRLLRSITGGAPAPGGGGITTMTYDPSEPGRNVPAPSGGAGGYSGPAPGALLGFDRNGNPIYAPPSGPPGGTPVNPGGDTDPYTPGTQTGPADQDPYTPGTQTSPPNPSAGGGAGGGILGAIGSALNSPWGRAGAAILSGVNIPIGSNDDESETNQDVTFQYGEDLPYLTQLLDYEMYGGPRPTAPAGGGGPGEPTPGGGPFEIPDPRRPGQPPPPAVPLDKEGGESGGTPPAPPPAPAGAIASPTSNATGGDYSAYVNYMNNLVDQGLAAGGAPEYFARYSASQFSPSGVQSQGLHEYQGANGRAIMTAQSIIDAALRGTPLTREQAASLFEQAGYDPNQYLPGLEAAGAFGGGAGPAATGGPFQVSNPYPPPAPVAPGGPNEYAVGGVYGGYRAPVAPSPVSPFAAPPAGVDPLLAGLAGARPEALYSRDPIEVAFPGIDAGTPPGTTPAVPPVPGAEPPIPTAPGSKTPRDLTGLFGGVTLPPATAAPAPIPPGWPGGPPGVMVGGPLAPNQPARPPITQVGPQYPGGPPGQRPPPIVLPGTPATPTTPGSPPGSRPVINPPVPGPPVPPPAGPPSPTDPYAGGSSGARTTFGARTYSELDRILRDPGYDAATRSAMTIEGQNAARAATAGARGQIARRSAATGNSAGATAGLAELGRAEAGVLGQQARRNVMDQFAEAERQREWATQGVAQLYGTEGSFLANLFGTRAGLAGRVRGTSTRSRTRTDAPFITL